MKEFVTCAEAREEFSALLDGELDSEEQDGVQRHLAECADCLRELDGLKKVSDACEDLPDVDAPEELVDFDNEHDPFDVDLSDLPRAAVPVSFKPVLVALLALAGLTILSYLITQTASQTNGTPPPLVTEDAD